MKKAIVTLLLIVVSCAGIATAFSNGGGNSAAAPGQVKAIENCIANIVKQNAAGQTGVLTGSASDSKQLNTAVTNCDNFWN